MYADPNGEIIYTHEGLCYTVEYEWFPSDGPGIDESIEIRVLRGGEEVQVPPVLKSRMTTAALRDARLTQGGLCRRPASEAGPWSRVPQVPPPPRRSPKAGSRRAQIFSVSPAGRR